MIDPRHNCITAWGYLRDLISIIEKKFGPIEKIDTIVVNHDNHICESLESVLHFLEMTNCERIQDTELIRQLQCKFQCLVNDK